MGICASCDAAAISPVSMTAKLILPDGDLREFTRPVPAAHVLQGDPAACFFVCDADEMEFDGRVSALAAADELRPGQLYFLLPRSMLKHPLHAEDLAALARTASAALMRAAKGDGRCGRRTVAPLVFPEGEKAEMTIEGGAVAPPERKKRLKKVNCRRGCKFTPDLIAIPE